MGKSLSPGERETRGGHSSGNLREDMGAETKDMEGGRARRNSFIGM
ncbi:MAG: hypothetical protein KBG12_00885 [Syntrophobacterales bacterium]|nr:hypothetical protein [Syntrophobacterales bacterium]